MLRRCRMLIQRLSRPRVALPGIALLVLLAGAGWRVGRHLWASYHFRAARQSLEQRDFAAADAHLHLCLAVWGDDGASHLLAARCARRAGRLDEAERHLARCRKVEGAALEAALLRVQRGQLGDAESYLKRTIAPDHPDAALALEALALGYAKTERLANLLECTALWLQVRPEDPQALTWRGYAWERLRNATEARTCYERAVAADPTYDDARLPLGNLLLQRFKQPREGVEQFENVRQRRPEEPAVLLGLARGYRLLDRLDEAEQAIESLLARHPDRAEALTERGKLALARGQLSEAEGWLRQAATRAADDREALYSLIQCLHQRGQEEEARACTARLRKLETDLARMDELIAEIGRHPNDPDLRRQAGVICLRYGKDQEGLHWLHSALQAVPSHSATHAVLAEYYAQRGHADQAALHRRLVAGK
jgi:tetratricopeptide (TPR) repeat protein